MPNRRWVRITHFRPLPANATSPCRSVFIAQPCRVMLRFHVSNRDSHDRACSSRGRVPMLGPQVALCTPTAFRKAPSSPFLFSKPGRLAYNLADHPLPLLQRGLDGALCVPCSPSINHAGYPTKLRTSSLSCSPAKDLQVSVQASR